MNRLIGLSVALGALLAVCTVSAQTKPAPAAKPGPAPAQNANLEKGIDTMFKAIDTDKNGALSFQEFQTAVIAQRRQAQLIQQLQAKFRSADTDKSGTLNIAEFNKLPAVVNSPNPKPAFTTFDSNKDQAIDFREYLMFVQQVTKATPPPPKK